MLKVKISLFLFTALFLQSFAANSQDLHSIPGAKNTYYTGLETDQFESTLKMRESRRVGAGVTVGGVLGIAGFNGELNIEDADAVTVGFGTGQLYKSIQFGWKHALDGDYLAPYYGVNYSRWYNSHGQTENISRSDILNRVLTSSEKKEGQFGLDFMNISAGVQYNQLSGEMVGFSVFGELVAMYEIKRAILIPSGSIGTIYYF